MEFAGAGSLWAGFPVGPLRSDCGLCPGSDFKPYCCSHPAQSDPRRGGAAEAATLPGPAHSEQGPLLAKCNLPEPGWSLQEVRLKEKVAARHFRSEAFKENAWIGESQKLIFKKFPVSTLFYCLLKYFILGHPWWVGREATFILDAPTMPLAFWRGKKGASLLCSFPF